MKCEQSAVALPVDFEGQHLNVLISAQGKVWVCIDGKSVLRARGLRTVTIEDQRFLEQIEDARKVQLGE